MFYPLFLDTFLAKSKDRHRFKSFNLQEKLFSKSQPYFSLSKSKENCVKSLKNFTRTKELKVTFLHHAFNLMFVHTLMHKSVYKDKGKQKPGISHFSTYLTLGVFKRTWHILQALARP